MMQKLWYHILLLFAMHQSLGISMDYDQKYDIGFELETQTDSKNGPGG